MHKVWDDINGTVTMGPTVLLWLVLTFFAPQSIDNRRYVDDYEEGDDDPGKDGEFLQASYLPLTCYHLGRAA